MGSRLVDVFNRTPEGYEPLSQAAIDRIFYVDSRRRAWDGGRAPNVNRFYLYLTQKGDDVQVRTVAVKAPKRWADPVAKEIVCSSVDDPYLHVRDLGLNGMAGYSVDWSPEGFGPARYWSYEGRWEAEPWALRCCWKIHAPVVNPELLGRTRRFRYSDYESSSAHILDYLKVFSEHPEVEFLSKAGLGWLSTRVSVVRKLKKDRDFRTWFGRHVEEIKAGCWSVPEIMKVYKKKISIDEARYEIEAKREFSGTLPSSVGAVKARRYIDCQGTSSAFYVRYLADCQALGMDLADTKVSFPKQFNERRQAVADELSAIRAKADADKQRKVSRQLAAVAEQWAAVLGAHGSRSFRVVIPSTEQQLSAEGKAMRNCLGGSYAARIARGVSVIVFVRRASAPDAAFVAVEYSIERDEVVQCYAANNSKPPKAVREFVERLFDGARQAAPVLDEVAA